MYATLRRNHPFSGLAGGFRFERNKGCCVASCLLQDPHPPDRTCLNNNQGHMSRRTLTYARLHKTTLSFWRAVNLTLATGWEDAICGTHQQDINRSPTCTHSHQARTLSAAVGREVKPDPPAGRRAITFLLLFRIYMIAIKSDADISENDISTDWSKCKLIKKNVW